MDILRQLGELFVQAVPTVVIVFLFYLFMRWAFFRPIQGVLAERRARIEGTRREAEEARAAAQERERAYHDALRRGRGEIYAEQEAERRALLDARVAHLREARAMASEQVRAAKARIEIDLEAARREVEESAPALGAEIARAILGGRPGTGLPSEAR